MEFIFCEAKGQRVSKAVCEHNFRKGHCTKDLLKCEKTKKAKAHAEKPKAEPMPKIVTEAANCGPLFAGLDNKSG